MTTRLERRLGAVWLALVAVTLLSWWIGSKHGGDAFVLNAPVTLGVLAIAAVKVRVITHEFMELRHAPAALRLIADAWLLVLIVLLGGLYLLGTPQVG